MVVGGVNLYRFNNGDQVSFGDPLGLMGCDPPNNPDCPIAKLQVPLGLQPVEAAVKGPLVGNLKVSLGPSARATLSVTVTSSGITSSFGLSSGVSAGRDLGSASASARCQLSTGTSGCGGSASMGGLCADSGGVLEVGVKSGVAGAKASFNPANAISAIIGGGGNRLKTFIGGIAQEFNFTMLTLRSVTTPVR